MPNFEKVEQAARDQASNRTVGAGYVRMKSGETARMRILDVPEEPFNNKVHWHNRLQRNITCAEGWPGFAGCACCHFAATDNAIGRPNTQLSFTVILDRMMHIVKTVSANKEERKFFPCQKPKSCDLCAAGNQAVREGKRHWDMAVKHAQTMAEEDRKLHKRCASCNGVGLLSVVGHECPACGEPLDGLPEDAGKAICSGCKGEIVPTRMLACSSGCKTPTPRSITDCWLEVKRIGEGQTTLYSFDPGPPSALSEEDLAVKAFDFKAIMRPKAQSEVAKQLGFLDPFGGAADPAAPAASQAAPGSVFEQVGA